MMFLESIIPLFLFLFAGMAVSGFRFIPSEKHLDKTLMVTLQILLLFMGVRIGRTPGIETQILSVGGLASCLAMATISGSVVVIILFSRFFGSLQTGEVSKEQESSTPVKFMEYLKDPIKLLLLVLAGGCFGFYSSLFPNFNGSNLITWLLYVLLFVIGIQMVRSEIGLKKLFLRPEAILVPVGTILGSFIGGLVVMLFTQLTVGQALALSSGFGWYSLSGALITEMGNPILGSTAFMADILREMFTLLLIPLFGRLRQANLAIGAAGATSMDVTLPIIERSCGSASVPTSIASGAITSFLVPILIPTFFHL